MSTEKYNVDTSTDARFAILARMGEVVFHARDTATLWGITNVNTLYITLSRYVRAGLLFRLHNGLYSIKPIDELDPLLVGTKVLHGNCYVSTETVLVKAGVIQQHVAYTTLVGTVSRRFVLGGHRFRCRRLSNAYLYNEVGIMHRGDVRIASTTRAVADMLYFDPHYHFDASAYIDWDLVRKMQGELGYPLTNR
ncbi:MAG: hypothetical protein Q8Q18_03820 [bacterium]|nr:hypothetical protein [bacterium]